jgi:hypothetical protein
MAHSRLRLARREIGCVRAITPRALQDMLRWGVADLRMTVAEGKGVRRATRQATAEFAKTRGAVG